MVRFMTALLIIGGLNWGLVGLFQFDLVAAIFGGQAALISRIVYTLVGVAALFEVFAFGRLKRAEVDTTTNKNIHRIDRAA